MSSVPLILFASTSARAKDALADVNVALSTLLTREVKTLQGHVIFTVDGAASTEVIAAQLLTCGTLDHVNVQLASCALNEFEGGALAAIRAAASAVTPAQLEAALELWRAVCRVAADGREAAAALPTAALVFRAIGKRGGRGHTFSSDDAKRAAKQGLTAASGLNGSTSDYHFDIVAQVHCNRFWLGLRLTGAPLAPQTHEPGYTASMPPPPPPLPAAASSSLSPLAAVPSAAPSVTPPTEKEAAAAAPATTATANSRRRSEVLTSADESAPPLLSSWITSRLAVLGLQAPRDARDAVTPLWEVDVEEQLRRKHEEMAAVVGRLLSGPPVRGASGGGGGQQRRQQQRQKPQQQQQQPPPPETPPEPHPHPHPHPHPQQYQEVEEAEVVVEQLEKLPPREQELCEPLRYHGASGGVPQRNVCDFHIGLDRSGLPCCGFRLGVGAAADGVAVAPPTGVCIVPAWMVAVAAEVSTALREWAAADATVASEVAAAAKEAPRLPFAALKLRGSRYTREAMAVLTAVEASDNEGSSRARERSLAACLVEAAAGQNHRLTAVLIKEASSGTLRPVETDASATAAEAPTGGGLPSGSLLEQLSSGLRLRVSPLSFFQASTDASEALFATIAELATWVSPSMARSASTAPYAEQWDEIDLLAPPPPLPAEAAAAEAAPARGGSPSRHYPSVLLDLCCGGGAIGLEIARAAAASGACTRVIGIESCAAAVDDARANAVLNGLSPPAYVAVCAKVEDAIEGDVVRAAIASASTSASSIGDASGLGGGRGGVVAVLDPPRTGVHPSVCKALRASPEVDRIVFVSCNPHGFTLRHDYVVKGGSLAANARLLCGKGRGAPFCLSRAIPVDLFPHTPHCELCLLFERRRL